MKLELYSGEIIDNVRIKIVPAILARQYGYKKIAHWIDKGNKAPCSCPAKRERKGYYKEVL